MPRKKLGCKNKLESYIFVSLFGLLDSYVLYLI